MKKVIYFLICAICLLTGCEESKTARELRMIDSIVNLNADSAQLLLNRYLPEITTWSKGDQMHYYLSRLNAQNKAGLDMTSDSLAEIVAHYFSSHGSVNERVRAFYLLGRTYADMGESPRAIKSYQDAIYASDTTVKDFDFYTLSCVYSQMATVYRGQLLLTHEINARQKASQYAFRANQSYWGVYNQCLAGSAYILINKRDSAEIVLKDAIWQFQKYGYPQAALRFSMSLIHLYLDAPQRLDEVKRLIDQFDTESELFDKNHELPPSHRQYYYYKGMYYEGINRLDSAEYFYRKAYNPSKLPMNQEAMFKGLLSVYTKKHISDSIAKYSQLYCMVNDSSIALKDQKLTAQMAASYRYYRLLDDVRVRETEALQAKIWAGLTLFILILMAIAGLWFWYFNKEKQNRKQAEYDNAINTYKKNLRSLSVLENAHKAVIATIQQELGHAQVESRDFRSKYVEAQQNLESVNAQYKASHEALVNENRTLKIKIEQLELNTTVVRHMDVSKTLIETDIVQRIKDLTKHPTESLTEKELETLTNTMGLFYPVFIHDLKQVKDISQLAMRVCLLVALNLRPGDISNLLNISSQQVSNIRYDLNQALFNESSARTLYANLVKHYNIYVS